MSVTQRRDEQVLAYGEETGGPAPRAGSWIAVKAGIAITALLVLSIVEPSLLRDSVSSPRSFATVLGFVALFIGWSALLRRFVPNATARAALLIVPAAVAGWLLVVPYLRPPTTVDEALPGADRTAAAPAGAASQGAASQEASGDAALTGPARVAAGTLVGIGHRATGGVGIYQLEDGSAVVRLEDVDIENAPDVVVYLVPGAGAEHPTDGAVSLGALKGNQGSHNYALPPGADASGSTVLVYCRAFSVPIAHATLRPA
ncbi:MAG: DM13 domain-containing protein [Egibacteraceae bacterium]